MSASPSCLVIEYRAAEIANVILVAMGQQALSECASRLFISVLSVGTEIKHLVICRIRML